MKPVSVTVELQRDDSGDIFMYLGPNAAINLTFYAHSGNRNTGSIITRNILEWADSALKEKETGGEK